VFCVLGTKKQCKRKLNALLTKPIETTEDQLLPSVSGATEPSTAAAEGSQGRVGEAAAGLIEPASSVSVVVSPGRLMNLQGYWLTRATRSAESLCRRMVATTVAGVSLRPAAVVLNNTVAGSSRAPSAAVAMATTVAEVCLQPEGVVFESRVESMISNNTVAGSSRPSSAAVAVDQKDPCIRDVVFKVQVQAPVESNVKSAKRALFVASPTGNGSLCDISLNDSVADHSRFFAYLLHSF
jgi:hypothetical protein